MLVYGARVTLQPDSAAPDLASETDLIGDDGAHAMGPMINVITTPHAGTDVGLV